MLTIDRGRQARVIEYMKDIDSSLNVFSLARESSVGEDNVDTYASDKRGPQELLKEVLDVQGDPNNTRRRASSSYTNDRHQREAMDEDDSSNDEES